MDWLAEISTDLREAAAHLSHVHDNALYTSTVTPLYRNNNNNDYYYLEVAGGREEK